MNIPFDPYSMGVPWALPPITIKCQVLDALVLKSTRARKSLSDLNESETMGKMKETLNKVGSSETVVRIKETTQPVVQAVVYTAQAAGERLSQGAEMAKVGRGRR
jgi:hypothetical protein